MSKHSSTVMHIKLISAVAIGLAVAGCSLPTAPSPAVINGPAVCPHGQIATPVPGSVKYVCTAGPKTGTHGHAE